MQTNKLNRHGVPMPIPHLNTALTTAPTDVEDPGRDEELATDDPQVDEGDEIVADEKDDEM